MNWESRYSETSQSPINVPGSRPFQKMDSLFRAVIAVPKTEIDRREKEWTLAQKRKKAAKR
jgi:hypothetical protein